MRTKFHEQHSPYSKLQYPVPVRLNANAAPNMSVFRNIVINIFRGNGFSSVKNASVFL